MHIKTIPLIVLLLVLSCTGNYTRLRETKEFVVVSPLLGFLASEYGFEMDFANSIAAIDNPEDELLVFYDAKTDQIFLNSSANGNSLSEVFKNSLVQKKWLVLVCDPRATVDEREKYYDLYKTYMLAGKAELERLAFIRYGKKLEKLTLRERTSLGFHGPSFLFHSTHISDISYQVWIENFGDVKAFVDRGIPFFMSPP